MAKRLGFGFIALIALLGAFNLVTGQLSNFADDPGVGWHLKTGELIVNYGFVPQYDPFLASETSRPWVSDQWLSDVIIWLIFRSGGWPLMYAAFVSIFVLTFFVALFKIVYKFTQNSLASSLAVMIAFKLAEVHFILRPVVFSFAIFVLVYLVLYKLEHDYRSGKISANLQCLTLPLLFLVWANIHPSFTIGLTIFGILLTLSLIRCFCKKRNLAQAVLILILFIGSLAVTVFNPYALELHRSIVSLAHSDFFMNFHMEWQPPRFESFEGGLLLFSLLVVLVGFTVKNKLIPLGSFEILSLIIFAYLSIKMIRILPYYGIVVSIPLAASLVNLGSPLSFIRFKFLKPVKESLRRLSTNDSPSIFWPALIALAVPFTTQYLGRVPLYDGQYGPSQAHFPAGALSWLNSIHMSKVVLAPPEWGGYITYFGDKARAVIDDRNTLLGESFYRSYFKQFSPTGDFQEYVRCTGATHILVPKSSGLVSALAASYPMRYEDKQSLVFEVDPVPGQTVQCDNIVNY